MGACNVPGLATGAGDTAVNATGTQFTEPHPLGRGRSLFPKMVMSALEENVVGRRVGSLEWAAVRIREDVVRR